MKKERERKGESMFRSNFLFIVCILILLLVISLLFYVLATAKEECDAHYLEEFERIKQEFHIDDGLIKNNSFSLEGYYVDT